MWVAQALAAYRFDTASHLPVSPFQIAVGTTRICVAAASALMRRGVSAQMGRPDTMVLHMPPDVDK